MRPRVVLVGILLAQGCFLFETERPPVTDDTDLDPPQETCPNLVLSTEVMTWKDVPHGTSVVQSLEVMNSCEGTGILTTSFATGEGAFFTVTETGAELAPNEALSVDVIFAPMNPGDVSDVLTVRGSDGAVYEVTLSGNATTNPDWDGDGFESIEAGGEDCDDTDARVYPGAPDACYDGLDRNCDGANEYDCDQDGYEADAFGGADCNDEDGDVSPRATEVRNGDDDDCDGVADEQLIQVGDVVFSEFMSNPKNTPDSRGEWFEVRNTTTIPVDMDGWIVTRADESFVVNASVRIPPLGHRVFANSDNPGRNGGFVGHYEFDAASFSLPNTTNQVYELSFGGKQITAIPVQAAVISEGVSIGLDPRLTTFTEALDWSRWCLATQQMSGGDFGTPGLENRLCPGLDDVDGDGYTLAGGDCDDNDALVNPGASEVWGDWTDNDCSGQADEANMSSLTSTTLDGGTTNSNPHQWGYLGQLGRGDVDDDGKDEWMVGGVNSYDYVGGVVLLPSESYGSFSGAASSIEEGHVEGYDEKQAFGVIGAIMADNSGDGIADLVVGGHDYFEPSTTVAVALFAGGKSVSGTLSDGDATAEWTGSESSREAALMSHMDWDGDGVAEVLYGEPRTFYGAGGDNYRGRVVWLDGDGASGSIKLSDSDAIWEGSVNSDAAGTTMASIDLDGDGYGDVALSAPGRDDEQTNGGAVYLLYGDATGPGDDELEDVYDFKITGHLAGANLGSGVEPMFADVDGDGDLDLLVSAYEKETVYGFFEAKTLKGDVSTSSADFEVSGDGSPSAFGLGLAVGDVNGDGFDEVLIGAPDDDTSDPSARATVSGRVYMYSGTDLVSGAYDESHAAAVVIGLAKSDGFGQALLSVDLDADGTAELLIGEPGAASKKGRIRVWDPW